MNINGIPVGKKPPEELYAIIEIPKGGSVKYEFEKESGLLFVDRILHTAMNYPFNYGFVPHTLAEDGDPVDVMVLGEYPFAPGVVVSVRVIGVIHMKDEKGEDPKILAVPEEKIDPITGTYKDIEDVPEALKRKIVHFFEQMKALEPGKWVKMKEWGKKENALALVKKAIEKHHES